MSIKIKECLPRSIDRELPSCHPTSNASVIYTNPQAEFARNIKAPLLVCIADKEVYGNPDFQEWVGKQAPRGEVKRYSGEHFDFYHGLLERVVADEIAFFQMHLMAKA
jgi:hypothetical protein